MLKAINTKILLAILAALSAIGGAVTYQRHETEKAAAAAARSGGYSPTATEGTPKNSANVMRRSDSKWNRTRSDITPPQPMRVKPGRSTFLKRHRERVAIWFPWHC